MNYLSKISVTGSFLFCLSIASLPATAQVTTDGTTSTTVNTNGNNFEINDGDRAGGNLFHSFRDFSVGTGGEAFFNNANDIVNIFSRVTGGNISNIDGLLRANGSANLFLINPAGIIFGNNARLDIGGSFLGTSADSILFEDGEFSATDLDNPPLLTINAPIGLSLRDNPGQIVNRSFVENEAGENVGLEVLPGNNLTLVGGNINFEAGEATASGGNIELGGLSEAGIITINPDGSLSFPENVARADISLSNGADVDASGTGDGNVTVNARNLSLTAGEFGSSFIRAGIRPESTSAEAQAGDVTINVAENINLDDSRILNQVDTGGIGNSGNIIITTDSLEAINGGDVDASTFGQGDAGVVNITATGNLTFDGENLGGNPSGVSSLVDTEAVGNAGGVTISTNNLTLTNGGRIGGSTFGEGNAGAVNIRATGDITIDGEDSTDAPTSGGIFSTVGNEAIGNAAGVEITAENLTLTNAGTINANTSGRGNAGQVTVNVNDTISIDGEDLEGFPSGIASQVISGAVGDSGRVIISTGNLTLTNGGIISADTFSEGDAGVVNITATRDITADGENSGGFVSGVTSFVNPGAVGNSGGIIISTANLTLTNRGQVSASTFGEGDAGGVNITATEINIDGGDSDAFPSNISSLVNSGATGNSEGVTISTANLTLTNGGIVAADTSSQGDAGVVNITATRDITADGENSGGFVSGVTSFVSPDAVGNSGGVTISTTNLTLTNRGQVSASTFGEGDAGGVNITATEINIDGGDSDAFPSNISSLVNSGATGDSEGVTISTGNLTLTNGGIVSASTFGQGNAGAVNINATGDLNFDGENSGGFPSGVTSQVDTEAVGNAGGVTISTGNLTLTNGGRVDASTLGEGNAGAVNINATGDLNFDGENSGGFGSGVTSLVNTDAVGNAGGVTISPTNLTLTNGGRVSASTFGEGDAGEVNINATGNIAIDGEDSTDAPTSGGIFSTVGNEAIGNAAGVEITAENLTLTNAGTINANTSGRGNAGQVTVNVNDTISIDGEDLEGFPSGIASQVISGAMGDSGGVTIFTNNITLTNGGIIGADTFGEGDAGAVNINATGDLNFDGETSGGFGSGVTSFVNGDAVGNSGGVTISTANLTLTNGGRVTASTFGEGNAGEVNITATESILIDGVIERFRSGISANALVNNGNGGNVNITTDRLRIANRGTIEATNSDGLGAFTSGTGLPGNINIQANNIDLVNFGRIEAATQSTSRIGGVIDLQVAEDITLDNNSFISARAFGEANGGNLNIDTRFIVAFPNGNNNIIANANQGNGGNITISAESLFGIEERELDNLTNDINASSEQGAQFDGNVAITTPEVDAIRGATELPTNVVKVQQTTAEACAANPDTGKPTGLTVKGKGGIIPPPNSPLSADVLNIGGKITAERSPSVHDSKGEENAASTQINPESAEIEPIRTSKGDIYPARGIIKTADGRVILTAYPTENIATRTPTAKRNCH
jgi:filamentous hemagglutinin family protein